MISKDESIVNQVAAKIASELTDKSLPMEERLAEFAIAYPFVYQQMSDVHGFGKTAPAPTFHTNGIIEQAFPGSTEVGFSDADFREGYTPSYAQQSGAVATMAGVRIKGTQHGPLPDWLFAAAAEAGVTEVWDNRDGLAENPTRPWFKATSGGKDAKAFWPPKQGGRR